MTTRPLMIIRGLRCQPASQRIGFRRHWWRQHEGIWKQYGTRGRGARLTIIINNWQTVIANNEQLRVKTRASKASGHKFDSCSEYQTNKKKDPSSRIRYKNGAQRRIERHQSNSEWARAGWAVRSRLPRHGPGMVAPKSDGDPRVS